VRLKYSGLIFSILLACLVPTIQAQEPVRVGVLYSQTGTMAISETVLKDAMLMLIDQQNQRGGLLGRPLEVVALDPASNWSMYAEKARQLIAREEVAVIFGCWTSASRKAVKNVVEELDALLFYPVQYEGQEASRNIIYLGAAPNQQALPAVQFLQAEMGIERWVLAGTDYVYPRTTNTLLADYLQSVGVAREDIMLSYTPFGHTDWQRIVSDIKQFGSTGRKTAVVSTINGDANIAFYRELTAQDISAEDIPVMAFSIGEPELQAMDVAPLVGHLAAWNYFMSIPHGRNEEFVSQWQDWSTGKNPVTSDPMEAQAIGFQMWVSAVEKAGTTDTEKVREALIGITAPNFSGGTAQLLANHHISKPAYIGEILPDGQYDVIWRSVESIPGNPWFDPVTGKLD